MSEIQKRTEDYWKKEGVEFDGFYGKISNFSPRKVISKFLEKRTKILREFIGTITNKNILDLGCGSGIQMLQLAPLCRKITGVDISRPMLDSARKLLERLPVKNWELVSADAGRLPFADKSFDVIFGLGLLDYVAEPKAVLQECRRILKEGGSVIFTIPKIPSPFAFFRTRIGNILRRRILNLPPIINAVSPEGLAGLLRVSGFVASQEKSIWQTMWIVKAEPAKTPPGL